MNVSKNAMFVTNGLLQPFLMSQKIIIFKLSKVNLTLVTRGREKVKLNQIENAIMAQNMHKKKIFDFKTLFFLLQGPIQ